MAEGRTQGARAGLDRHRVVRVALDLLDEVGLDDLSMRRLAERLGVTAASLYWHVRDKGDLLTLLADAISAEMPLPDPTRSWRDELIAYAHEARRVALAHRDAARVLVATIPTGPHRLQRIEALLEVLRRAGFRPADVADAAYLLNVYISGFVLDEVLSPRPPGAGAPAPPGFTAPLGALRHGRLLVEHGAANMTIRTGKALDSLYGVTFEGRAPEVEQREGTLLIRQQHGRNTSCVVALSPAIPWEIAVEGGTWRMRADLSGLRLAALHISGGAADTSLRLPLPTGTAPVRIDGGVRRLRVERPDTVALRVHLSRGSRRLTFDGLRLGSVGGGTDWESPGYASAADRYDLGIGGGVDELTVAAVQAAPETGTPHGGAGVHGPFAALSPELYPNLVALADQLIPDQDRRFAVGLQILLDGLERRLGSQPDNHRPKRQG